MATERRDILEAQLSAYLDGELSERERAEVERFLAQDEGARALLAELRATAEALRSLPRARAAPELMDGLRARLERRALLGDDRGSAPSAVPAVPGRRWVAAAAVIALATVAGYVTWSLNERESAPPGTPLQYALRDAPAEKADRAIEPPPAAPAGEPPSDRSERLGGTIPPSRGKAVSESQTPPAKPASPPRADHADQPAVGRDQWQETAAPETRDKAEPPGTKAGGGQAVFAFRSAGPTGESVEQGPPRQQEKPPADEPTRHVAAAAPTAPRGIDHDQDSLAAIGPAPEPAALATPIMEQPTDADRRGAALAERVSDDLSRADADKALHGNEHDLEQGRPRAAGRHLAVAPAGQAVGTHPATPAFPLAKAAPEAKAEIAFARSVASRPAGAAEGPVEKRMGRVAGLPALAATRPADTQPVGSASRPATASQPASATASAGQDR